jgi:small subunit ribosomal protein S6
MPRNIYEIMFILDTSKIAGDLPAAVSQLHSTFEKHGSEILASRHWDERKLAYPIGHQKKGEYYLIYVRCDAKEVANIEREFKLNESILRYLIIYIDPKWEEQMLAVARDEHALALQGATTEDGIEGVDDYMPRRRDDRD